MIATCKNHRELRWSCKDIAWSPGSGYNGLRHLFFFGIRTSDGNGWTMFREDGTYVQECPCPIRDLIEAPEHKELVEKEKRPYMQKLVNLISSRAQV